jgi:putative glycosyltransferase (exosortase G-associated)
MANTLLAFFVFWGIWIVVPLLIDGLSALTLFVGVVWARLAGRLTPPPPVQEFHPRVSLIIPVLNGERTLSTCLASLRFQTYPHECLEVFVVDNGSTDGTFAVFQQAQAQSFGGQLHWISTPFRGKAWALNAGIHLTSGKYLINIDADVVLAADAISQMVAAFEADPNISAATGGVEVLPARPDDERLAHLIAECEFQEYLSAFWMGRQYQSLTQSLYTLAGAFSAFRRDVLLQTFLYDKLTVSEDTKLTLDIYKHVPGAQIVCVPQAIAYVTPTPSLAGLYAQRVRWQRGQLEVVALHAERINFNVLQLRGLALSRLMMIDHTLLFPRLIWTFLFPLMTAFGYPLSLVVSATLFMYVFYIGINAVTALSMYMIAGEVERERLRAHGWIVALMPAYRFLIFIFRLAGSLIALAEPAEWRVADPVTETRRAGQKLLERARHAVQEYRQGSAPKA